MSDVIERLHQSEQSSDTTLVDDLVIRISSSYFDFDDHLIQICDEFVNKNVLKPIHYFLSTLSEARNITDQTLDLLYTFLINFSDYSLEFANALHSSAIFTFIIDNCLRDSYVDKISDKSVNELFQNCLKIINNVVRDPGNIITYRLADFKTGLVKFIKVNDNDMLGVMSMLTLSYIVEEHESHLLDEGSNVINLLLQRIRQIMESGSRSGGFSISELMHGIRCISANDRMKRRIRECRGIPTFLEILRNNNESEVEPVLGTIWNLCFINEIKMELINDYHIESAVEPFKNHQSEKIRRNHEGILWEIRERMIRRQNDPGLGKTISFDVFISYAWSNKKKILEICTFLGQFDIRVWIDDEQMFGSTLGAMASGIENSSLFIIGISSSYMKSPNCRSEAEYAYQIKKPIIPLIMELKYKPHNWLGLIMGTKVYYEFSERRQAEETITGLVKSIKLQLDSDGVPEIDCGAQSGTEAKMTSGDSAGAASTSTRLSEAVRAWSCARVRQWLEEARIDGVKKRLADVDGSLLAVMLEVRSRSPEYFNKTLKREFGMKFVDVLRFHRALDGLIAI